MLYFESKGVGGYKIKGAVKDKKDLQEALDVSSAVLEKIKQGAHPPEGQMNEEQAKAWVNGTKGGSSKSYYTGGRAYAAGYDRIFKGKHTQN